MVGKKKREKYLGLSLPRIGSSLVPNAVFTAVPGTAQRLAETWPRKGKPISALVTALGSVGNLAQAVVIGVSPTEEFKSTASPARVEDSDEYSEDHYAVVDENMRNRSQRQDVAREGNVNSGKNNEEVIYATVNKRRKPQEIEELSTSSEDDITDVSGMYSDEGDSVSEGNEPEPTYEHGRRKSSKRKSKKNRHSPQHISPQAVEEHVTKSDINGNFLTTEDNPDDPTEDIPDGLHLDNNDLREKLNNNGQQIRNYFQPSEFEREQFNETTLEQYITTPESSPLNRSTTRELLGSSAPDLSPSLNNSTKRGEFLGANDQHISSSLKNSTRRNELVKATSDQDISTSLNNSTRREELLGASAPDIVEYPEVPPIGERETPIGKGLSSEDVGSFKEKFQLGKSKTKQRDTSKHQSRHSQKEKQRKVNVIKDGGEEGLVGKERLSFSDYSKHLVNSPEIRDQIQSDQMTKTELKEDECIKETNEKVKKKHKTKKLSKVVEQVRSDELQNYEEDQIGTSSRQNNHNGSVKRTSKRHRTKHVDSESPVTTAHDSPETLHQMTLAKETCRKLRRQVKVLDQEKSALESLSESLNKENKTLKNLTQSLTNIPEIGSGTSFSLIQLQNEELKNENNFLKDSVHRLNMELGRYQAKFRPLPPQEMDTMFQSSNNEPVWLMDKKYLAPLILAYDDRLNEKQDIIKVYEEELQKFKEKIEKIVQENMELREGLSKSQILSHNNEECMQLEEQAKLVLEENAVLMERQEMQNSKMEELKTFYKEEVSRLSKLYTTSESERDVLKSKLEVLNTSLHEVQQELGNTSNEWKKRISVEEHLEIVNECRRKLETLKKKTEEETEFLNSQVEAVRKEKENLAVQLADYKLVNVQLEREIHKFTDIQRKNERKTLLLKEKLVHAQERETTAQDTLSEVLKVAEKTSAERDALNDMLVDKKSEQKKIESLVRNEEDKLKECQNKSQNKIAAMKGRVKEQERVTEKLRERYENEINSLKVFIRHQQRQLEDMVNDKRNLENELGTIYQNVSSDALKNVT